MITQGLSLPLHLGSIPDAMEAVLREYGDDFAPGNVVILNAPYLGGMHLPDIFMFKPIFVGDHLLGFAVLVAHHNDMGGRVPGSSAADSTEIYQEGLRIPIVKLYRQGVRDETLIKVIGLNVRLPEVVLGDIQAQLAACRMCERGMIELAERYGVAELEAYFEALLDYSETAARRMIAAMPDGIYRFRDHLDDDGVRLDAPVPVQVAIEIRGDSIAVDFAGSSPQVPGAINCTLSFAKSAVYFAVRAVMDADVPNNAGFVRPITVKAEPGTIVNPRPPSAVAARGVTGFRVIDALLGALAQAVPERVRGAGEDGTTSYSIAGYDTEGRYRMFREAIMGNWGGGYGHEGLDGAANPACNIGNAPVQFGRRDPPRDLGDLLLAGRRVEERHVGARLEVMLHPLDSGLQTLDRDRIGAGDQHEVGIIEGIARGPKLARELGDRHDALVGVVAAALGEGLVLKVQARDAGALEGAHRALHVERVAVACVGVGDQRQPDHIGNLRHALGDFGHGEQAEVRQA
jgi:N-methylhydantoinase B